MADNYKVHKSWVKEAEFEILVLEIPESEIEDKLAYLARDKGSITKSFYEDFIIATCIANINQLLFHIKQQYGNSISLMKVREEVINEVLKVNPILEPTNLVINHNSVVKLKGTNDLKEDERLLTDNKSWNVSYYDETTEKSNNDSDVQNTESPDKKEKKSMPAEMKNIEELTYQVTQQWWSRINKYVEIKKYNEEDINSILSQRFFHNRSTFQTFIVSVCVINSEELFTLLDNMGLPSRVAPPILMHEVYELCRKTNPFLTYERAQELTDDLEKDDNSSGGNNQGGHDHQSLNKLSSNLKKQKNKKKNFKAVTKEELLRLGDAMKISVIGQDEAVDNIVESVQRASVGLKDPIKPIGSFLFAGKTGCGKTLTAKVLANELIREKNNLITIDCSEYAADHEYSKLIGCFVPGTKVLMADGSRKSIEKIVVGDRVITHKGRSRNVEFVHEYEQDGEMLEITTVNSNIPEIMTKTHEILTIKSKKCTRIHRPYVTCKPTCSSKDCSTKQFENYNLEWTPAKDLTVGDIVAYPRYKPTGEYPESIDLANYVNEFTNYKYNDEFVWGQKHIKVPRYIKVDENFTRLAGYYVSEGGGSISGKTINFTFHSKEHNYIIEVVKLIRKIFGNDVKIRIEDRSLAHSYRIHVSSKIVCTMMSDLFGCNTYVKKTPAWFKDLPDDLLKGFLETAVFGDGCQVIPRRMDYSTVSETLHSQMELFFRRLGYITTTSLERKSKVDPNCKDRYRLYIGGSQIEKLNAEFNFDIDLSDMKLTNIQRMAWIDDEYVYKQIKKIDTINYTGKVYDLAVEEDVSYVLDFIVHNSPNGYVGFEQGGILTNAVAENPFSIVVFDEVEKASHKVHELMLQILDEGRLTDNKGQKVSFKDTIIIMTSNIGVSEVDAVKKTVGFGDVAKLTEDKKVKAIDEAIKKKFKPEFLNRIDSIVHFKMLNRKDYMRIIDIELYKLNENLKTNDTEFKDIELKFDKKTKDYVFKHGIDENYGARPLKRYIEKEIATPLANKLLRGNINENAVVLVTMSNDKIDFKVKKPTEKKEKAVLTATI